MAKIEYNRPSNLTLESLEQSLRSIVDQSNRQMLRLEKRPSEKGIGTSYPVSFQVPQIANTTLTVTTSGRPAFHNIASITGNGMEGVLSQSVVSGIARINVLKEGHVNLTWEDEVELVSSNAGTGADGEFVWAITHYNKDNTDIRSWLGDHIIGDPILSAYRFPFSQTTGLIPVNVGDYFTFNFAFNINQANKRVIFSLPADNPGLDERIELIYFS